VDKPTSQDRRESERLPASEVPHLTARLEGNREVRLLDISRRGVQFDTSVRLRPGTNVALRLVAQGEHVTLTGRVVRSLVSALDGTQLVYRTALSFPEDIAFYKRPAPRDDASRAVQDDETGPIVANTPETQHPASPAVFDVTNGDADAKLHELLSANDW
jgi:hypothetical protein